MRVAVLSIKGQPLMPAKSSRVRRWLKSGKAKVVYNDLGIFTVQLTRESGNKTQPISVGIDPGLSTAAWEVVVARGDQGFSPVMVAQYWAISQLEKLLPVVKQEGWQTSNLRQYLGLEKQKTKKGDAIPATHAVDGISLASSEFVQYRQLKGKQGWWEGSVGITPAPFAVIRRPPVSRRQLHLMVPSLGGIRRKYGGTTTRHGFRKGDYVKAEMAGRVVCGWVSGDTERQISVSNSDWKRLGQFSAKKVQLLQRSTGLIVVPSTGLSNLPLFKGSI